MIRRLTFSRPCRLAASKQTFRPTDRTEFPTMRNDALSGRQIHRKSAAPGRVLAYWSIPSPFLIPVRFPQAHEVEASLQSPGHDRQGELIPGSRTGRLPRSQARRLAATVALNFTADPGG